MSSLAPLTSPTVASGTGLVNATALDGQVRLIVAKVNELVRAVGRLRRASDNTLGDQSVRLRNLADSATAALQSAIDNLAAIGAQIRTAIMDPLGGAITTARFPSGPQRVGEPINLSPGPGAVTNYSFGYGYAFYQMAFNSTWIFSSDNGADAGVGVVACLNRGTLTYTFLTPPPSPTPPPPGFGASVCVAGGKLFVGCYGWSSNAFPTSPYSQGRVFIYNETTLAYEGYLDDVSTWELKRNLGIAIASVDGNVVFVGANYDGGPGNGFVYVFVGGTFHHRFQATSPVLFGYRLHLSPDGAWLAVVNNRYGGSASEVVLYSISGSTETFHSRITNPYPENYFGAAMSWDPDSLGFWMAQAAGGYAARHFRWNGSAFAITAEQIGLVGGANPLYVTQDLNGSDLFVVRPARVSLLNAALTELVAWGATSAPYHRTLLQLSTTDFAVGTDTGVALSAYVPTLPPNGEYIYDGLVGTPLTSVIPITVPGAPGLTYRIKFRLRTMIEGVWVTDPTFPGYAATASGPTAASKFYTDAAPSDVLVDGRTYVSSTRDIDTGPYYYDNIRMQVDRAAGGTDKYVLNGLPAFASALDGKYFGITTIDGREPISPCWPIDTTLEFIVRAGDVITFTHVNADGSSALAGKTDFPADDDPRFPYLGRYRDAVALQLDLVDLEPISELAYAGFILLQLGGLFETEGPGGFLEV